MLLLAPFGRSAAIIIDNKLDNYPRRHNSSFQAINAGDFYVVTLKLDIATKRSGEFYFNTISNNIIMKSNLF